MAQRYWKLEKSGELGVAEVAAAVGGHIVLRTDVAEGKDHDLFHWRKRG
jgi:hypothetical protein